MNWWLTGCRIQPSVVNYLQIGYPQIPWFIVMSPYVSMKITMFWWSSSGCFQAQVAATNRTDHTAGICSRALHTFWTFDWARRWNLEEISVGPLTPDLVQHEYSIYSIRICISHLFSSTKLQMTWMPRDPPSANHFGALRKYSNGRNCLRIFHRWLISASTLRGAERSPPSPLSPQLAFGDLLLHAILAFHKSGVADIILHFPKPWTHGVQQKRTASCCTDWNTQFCCT